MLSKITPLGNRVAINDASVLLSTPQSLIANSSETETAPPGWAGLSDRQQDVLRLIAYGQSSQQIADWLCISYNTVIKHRDRISKELGLNGSSSLLCLAFTYKRWLIQHLPAKPQTTRPELKNHKPL